MINSMIAFLVLLNPFALFIFMQPVIRKMSSREMMRTLGRATIVSLVMFLVFAYTGNFFFQHVLQVQFDSFRIFGGIIIAYMSFMMIVQGRKSFITYSENHSAVASEMVMPLMVGVGTISVSILMGREFAPAMTALGIAVVMGVTYLVIMSLTLLRSRIVKRFEAAFDKNMETALRIIAFFSGAIGLNMVVIGIKGLWS